MKQTVSIGLCVLLGLLASISFATEVSVFGPEQYIRTKGAPNVYTDTFTGLFTEIVNTGKLIVLNGNQTGRNRISSAKIFINGNLIFGPSDFNQNVYELTAEVPLLEENTLSVEVRGKPGGTIRIGLIQEFDADGAEIIGPEGGVLEVLDNESPLYKVKVDIPENTFSKNNILIIKNTEINLQSSEKQNSFIVSPVIDIYISEVIPRATGYDCWFVPSHRLTSYTRVYKDNLITMFKTIFVMYFISNLYII